MHRLLAALLFVTAGCAGAPAKPSATVAAPAAMHAQQRLMGTWAIELTPHEARLLEIAKLALDDADHRADLAKLNPTEDEKRLYDDIVTLSSMFDPRLEQIERKVKRATMRLVVTQERVEVTSGDETLDVDATYT